MEPIHGNKQKATKKKRIRKKKKKNNIEELTEEQYYRTANDLKELYIEEQERNKEKRRKERKRLRLIKQKMKRKKAVTKAQKEIMEHLPNFDFSGFAVKDFEPNPTCSDEDVLTNDESTAESESDIQTGSDIQTDAEVNELTSQAIMEIAGFLPTNEDGSLFSTSRKRKRSRSKEFAVFSWDNPGMKETLDAEIR